MIEIILAQPRGFCTGVTRSIRMVEDVIQNRGAPVYVLHEIVHNRHVCDRLKRKGTIFVECLDEVPPGAVIIFSAHGISRAVFEDAASRGLEVFDATCPMVQKIHLMAERFSREGKEVIIIGNAGHPEVEGTLGRLNGPAHIISSVEQAEALQVKYPRRLAYITQTTQGLTTAIRIASILKRRFPEIKGPGAESICNATKSRQDAIHLLTPEVDLILVVGSRNSSNSNRLCEIGKNTGIPSFLIEDASELDEGLLSGIRKIGITAGASTPEFLVRGVLDKIMLYRNVRIKEMDNSQIISRRKSLANIDVTESKGRITYLQ